MVWPCWLAPSLLLLELMAQPTTVPLENESESDPELGAVKIGKKGEFAKVMAEHKKQTSALTKSTKHVFSVLNKERNAPSTKKKKGKGSDTTKPTSTVSETGNSTSPAKDSSKAEEKEQATPASPFPSLPTMLPLIHCEDAEASMKLCLQLLGLRSARKALDPDQLEKACPSPSKSQQDLGII